MKEFVRAGALVFSGLVVTNVLTYVFYASVTHAVGVDDAGLFMSLVSAIMIAALPAAVGGNVIAKIAADARGRDDVETVASLGAFAALMTVPIVLVVSGAMLAGLGVFQRFFHAHDAFAVGLAAAAFALTAVLLLQRAVFAGAGRFGNFVASNVVEAALKAAAGVATWTLHGGLRMALTGYVAATAAAVGYSSSPWIGSPRRARAVVPPAFVGRYLLGIALPTAALSAVSFADVLLVRHSLDAEASGLYAATALFGRAVLTAVQFVPTVLMPRVVAERSAGRSATRLLAAALAVTIGAIAIVLAGAAFAPRELLMIVAGSAFAAASPLLLNYTLAMGALAGATVLAAYLIALGRGGFVMPLVLVACAEIAAIAVYHPSADAVVHVVLAGHCALLGCCVPDALLSLVAGRRAPSASAPTLH